MGRGCKALLTGPGRKGCHAATHILRQRRRSRSVGPVTKGFHAKYCSSLLKGAGMMVLALIFTGMLAVGLEQRAEEREPVEDDYRPPAEPKY